MSFTVNEIHVDAQFDIIQNKGMDPRPAYARSSPVIHTKATGWMEMASKKSMMMIGTIQYQKAIFIIHRNQATQTFLR